MTIVQNQRLLKCILYKYSYAVRSVGIEVLLLIDGGIAMTTCSKHNN